MTFGEKVRKARLELKMSQDQLAEKAGISKRALSNYETGGLLPKSRETYDKLADVLQMEVSVLLDEDAEFVMRAREEYGYRGAKQALELVQQVTALYSGGELCLEDMEAMDRALHEAFNIAKKINKRHTNKRYLNKDAE